jgi:AraC family transcriptional regulator
MDTIRLASDNLYQQRIALVTNYIREHLADPLSLETLAQVACFSPFHFHRIFKSITGETVNDCVVRLRLARAVALLKASPDLPILTAALEGGFQSASNFSRSFKKQYGLSPRQWDRLTSLSDRADLRKNGQVFAGFPTYDQNMFEAMAEAKTFTMRFREMPSQMVAFVRVISSYQPRRVTGAYQRLIDWYRARYGDPATTTLIGMSQDDPDVTPLALCQYDLCLTLPAPAISSAGIEAVGEVQVRQFPACTLAYLHCVGDIYLVDRVWQYLYNFWLPRSRYQPDNLPAMEVFCRQPAEIGWERYDIDCAIPVVAL